MFTSENFKTLNSIWDGTASNAKEICGSCGACCHNVPKTLFPGEYKYLQEETGQMNSQWCSVGCLCWQLKNKVKPVICKMFPLGLEVPLVGDIVVTTPNEAGSVYTKSCSQLVYAENDLLLAKKYFDYLFSDIHNRVFYILSVQLDDIMENEKEYLKLQGAKVSPAELRYRCELRAMGIPIEDQVQNFVI